MQITVKQIKAARALLGWSQSELGARTDLTQTAIANIENGKHRPAEATLLAITRAFEQADLEFIEGGVRERPESLRIIEGADFEYRIQDLVFDEMIGHDLPEMMINGVDFKLMDEKLRDAVEKHTRRIQKAGKRQRILVEEGTKRKGIIGPPEWHRAVSSTLFSNLTPSFIYHHNYAVMLFEKKQVIIIRNASLAEYQARQFDWLWDNAVIL